jgi:hypothetical protein
VRLTRLLQAVRRAVAFVLLTALLLPGGGAQERIAGFIHIGTPGQEATERARPDPATRLVDWSPPA